MLGGFSASARMGASLTAAICFAAGIAPVLAPVLANSKVTVALSGAIVPSCALTGNGASAVREVQVTGTKPGVFQYGYDIECNAPFQYNVVSQNGAMAWQGQAAGSQAPSQSLPYTLAVHIPTDDIVIDDRCDSGTIKAGQVTCQFHNSGNGVAIDGHATLTVSWGQPPAALAAGVYSDCITFSVGLRQ
jgi:hypothetical protein